MSDEAKPVALPPEVISVIPEKYHKAENPVKAVVDALNASGGEVRKFMEKAQQLENTFKAPERYEFKPDELGFTPGDDVIAALREANLNQDQAARALAAVGKSVLPAVEKARKDAELKDLAATWVVGVDSPEFKQRIEDAVAWAKTNIHESAATVLATTAEGIRTIEAMRKAKASNSQTENLQSGGPARVTESDVKKWVADPRYKTDPKFQQWVIDQMSKM